MTGPRLLINHDCPALRCYRCDSNYLHHGDVKVYTRDTEDATDGVRVEVTRGHRGPISTVSRTTMHGNPSSRRDGIAISMECEECGALARPLVIVQHKGQTLMHWGKSDGLED